MWLHVNHIVELAMKLWGSHCFSWETLVSKDDHKNVAVNGELGQVGKWSTSSIVISELQHLKFWLCLTFLIHAPRVASMSQSPFRWLTVELSFLTAERCIDTSQEEGSSSIGYHEAFSVNLHNAMMGQFSYPFMQGLVHCWASECFYDLYLRSDWSSAHHSLCNCAISVSVQLRI